MAVTIPILTVKNNPMNNGIYPCLWFDGQAREAMIFYCSVFEQSEILEDTPMVIRAQLGGQLFMGLNGGPRNSGSMRLFRLWPFVMILPKPNAIGKPCHRGGMY